MPDEPPSPEPKLVTVAQAAFLVGVTVKQVRDWIKRGELWPLGTQGGHTSGTKLYSFRRCKELAAGYHARKAERSKPKQ